MQPIYAFISAHHCKATTTTTIYFKFSKKRTDEEKYIQNDGLHICTKHKFLFLFCIFLHNIAKSIELFFLQEKFLTNSYFDTQKSSNPASWTWI